MGKGKRKKRMAVVDGALNELESLNRMIETYEKLHNCKVDLKITRVTGEHKQADGQATLKQTFPCLAEVMKPGEKLDPLEMVKKRIGG